MHLVQRQIVELECNSQSGALHWQQELAQLCEERLNVELEKVFDRYDVQNQVIQIEHLSLNLGILDAQSFEEHFIAAVSKQLPDQLSQAIQSQHSDNQNIHHQWMDTFAYFLQHGILPWWTTVRSLDDLTEGVLQETNSLSTTYTRNILIKVLDNSNARQRLFLQFGLPIWQKLMEQMDEARWHWVNRWSNFLLRLLALESTISESQQTKLRHYMTQVLLQPEPPSLAAFLAKAIHEMDELSAFQQIIINGSWSKLEVSGSSDKNITEIMQALENELQNNMPGASTDHSHSDKDEIEAILTEEGIFIQNAGLVLLTPFLHEYLKSCGVANEEELLDEERGIHLLQWLVVDEKITAEYNLILNKLLCAFPLEKTIALELEINDEAKEQADLLLNSVIRYWHVLKNTSIEGLRESFLQRPGKLTRREDGWLLQVEQRSYDMLLEHLPWSYSAVKLPWMPEMLWVEWI